MADKNPTKWSYSQKPPISNYGTSVDARLKTITPDNPRGYVRLSTTSNDSIINGSSVKLHYAIDNNGTVTYADIDDQGNIRRQYNNIQEIASAGKFGYTPQTTLRIKDSLQNNLEQRTEQTILSSIDSPVAQTPPAPDQQGGNSAPGGQTPSAPSLPGPGEQPQTAELTNIDVAGGRGSSGLRYPKLMKDEQDKIKFQACKISRSSSSITSSPIYDPVDGPVFLAIQSSISDQNSVDWGPDSVSAIDSFVFDKSYETIKGDLKLPTSGETIEFFKSNQDRIQKYLAGQAAGLNNVLARTDNVILNPNLELLFQGPQLRPFTFTFKMSARSQDEAKEIKSIIKYFKYHMAVRKETGLFLRAPHVFTIRYLKGETENHPGINLISPTDDTKACALTNCSVDYTPLGSYATYEDGTMVAYTLSLQFQELTPIYDTDYTDAQSIGY